MMRVNPLPITVRTVTSLIVDWFYDHLSFFSFLIPVTGVLFLSLLTGCPQTRYKGYFLNVTNYDLKDVKWRRTLKGIRVYGASDKLRTEIDKRTDELESCLKKNGLIKDIRRDWFAVYVPSDWYVSTCSKEQLIPSRVNYKLCEAKGLTIPVLCRKVERPTKECPCVCNVRSCIQNSWIIVTAPNLKLYKTELARIILYPRANAPWADKDVVSCLR